MAYDEDLVSIVTPAFKAAKYIGHTIASVQAQSYGNWEMLIVDDCSPDDTAAVVTTFSAADPRVRLIRQKHNGGPAAARNAAIREAKGRWLAFLDSDDLWLPAKLNHQVDFQRRHGVKLTFTEFRRISADGSRIGHLVRVPDRLDYQTLLGNTAIATSTVIVDRALAGDIEMKKIYYDDFGCWLDVLRAGGFARGIHEDLMRYRVVGGSVSRNKRRSAMEVWKIYREVERLGRLASAYHFSKYALRGALKYRRF